MTNAAVYPGTFDPITFGHIDLIQRATRIFGKVIVAVAANTNKKPLFDLEERVDLAKQALANVKDVEVLGFECLLTNFMQDRGAKIILRGLRAVSDFDYEFQLAGMNRNLAPAIESVFMMPAENYTYISSSFVREIASLGGNVKQFVPDVVMDALKKRLGN